MEPLDALLVINELSRSTPAETGRFEDTVFDHSSGDACTDGDGTVTFDDFLILN